MTIETLSNKQKHLQRRTSIENHESTQAMQDFCIGGLVASPDEYSLNYYGFHLTQDEVMASSRNNVVHRIALMRRTEMNHGEVYCFEPEEVYNNKQEARTIMQEKRRYVTEQFKDSRIDSYAYSAENEQVRIAYWTYDDSIIGIIVETPYEVVTSPFSTKISLDRLRQSQMTWKIKGLGNTIAELIEHLGDVEK